jgi:hypothetical protein
MDRHAGEGGVFGIRRPILAADHPAGAAESVGRDQRDVHVTVEGPEPWEARRAVVEAALCLLELHPDQAHHAFGHGDVDVAADAVAQAVQQGGLDGGEGVMAGLHVGDHQPVVEGRGVGIDLARQHHVDAAEGMSDGGVGGAIGQRAALAETRDRTVDDLGVELRRRLVVQTQPGHRPGAEVLHDDVALLDQAPRQRQAGGRLEVEDDALLAGVVEGVDQADTVLVRRNLPHQVAAVARFDLDHLRAAVRQQARARRAGHHGGEVDDDDAFQRTLHHRAVQLSSFL